MKTKCVILACILWWGYPVMGIETPSYTVLKTHQNIEVRLYDPMTMAEVHIKGDRKDSAGVSHIGYIFGNNQSDAKMAMTAPVEQKQVDDAWRIGFVMPSSYTIDTLPQPNNTRINVTQMPKKTVVVIRFSGLSSNQNLEKNEHILMQYCNDMRFLVIGSPKYAFYNPPWTLPFLRRNEMMVEIQGDSFQ